MEEHITFKEMVRFIKKEPWIWGFALAYFAVLTAGIAFHMIRW